MMQSAQQPNMQTAQPNMQKLQLEAHGPLLLSLGRRDTKRLLEVYVKRSLSLSDKSLPRNIASKWVAQAKSQGAARSASDGSTYLQSGRGLPVRKLSTIEPSPTDVPADLPLSEGLPLEPEGSLKRAARKGRKSSLLKSFLGLFSKKGSEEKEGGRESSMERAMLDGPALPELCGMAAPVQEPPGEGAQGSLPSTRSRKPALGKRSLLKLSFSSRGSDRNRPQRMPSFRILPAEGQPEAIVCVEPISTYYEKVSEELEKIVKEVKDSPTDENVDFAEAIQARASMVAVEDEETIEKIINLLKQQGDAIDIEIKDSISISSFFQSLSYSSFQQLADRYVEEEVPSKLPEDTPAPELVKFAFTLDFTAKVAGLSNQAVSRIMGFGNQYLQDRFTQMSKAHVQGSQAEAVQSFAGPD
ncbi:hypothetical protein AGOR_G00140160 [Albula goreensis]|uniref:Uncharacterized protein n=1 Tax=Albula goreensis TaxID=1534307 RepID=A0A8T3DBY1_9TELE|nr:hypothetical protein AGOR_G00140160 [Albula goreensis]